MVLVSENGNSRYLPATPRKVQDVTGAGDMVLAVLGLCHAAAIPLAESMDLANAAAGLEVEHLGVVPVSREEIRAEMTGAQGPVQPAGRCLCRTRDRAREKLVTLEQMCCLAEVYRRAGKTVVLTNGCFDLIHAGHAAALEEAARMGDVLIVAINSDASVQRLKGPERPILHQADRARLLASLAPVDYVLVFEEDTPHDVLRRIRPDVLVKGGDYATEDVVGREVVLSYGGRVCVTGTVEGISTTAILASIRAAHECCGGNCHREKQVAQF
jgi:D-beta-D-heptose 7-phosphate kinase/D-beta-D-heptose 1-phosphate adenosyltransferase